jgi:hypothetical protein
MAREAVGGLRRTTGFLLRGDLRQARLFVAVAIGLRNDLLHFVGLERRASLA